MRRAALLAVVLMAFGAVPAAAEDGLEIVGVDVAGHPRVAITVAVPDPLSGVELPAEAFTIVENGYAVSAGVWTFAEEPLDVVLVMDTSGSMRGDPMRDARQAALGFLDRLPDAARVAVVSSGEPAELVHPLSGDVAGSAAALEALEAGGETALYDATVAAAGALPVEGPRAAVVVLSDGGDTVSTATLGDAVDALAASRAETFVVALQTDESDAGALGAIASAGGGSVVSVGQADELADALLGIADDLTGRYRLVYRTRESGPTDLAVLLAYEDVAASARTTLDLPAGADQEPVPGPSVATGSGSAAPEPAPPTLAQPPALLRRGWTLWVGVAAVFLGGFAVVGLMLTAERRATPFRRKRDRRGGVLSSLVHRAEDVAERAVRSRHPGKLDRDLDRAGLSLRPGEFVVLAASLAVATVAGALLVFGPPAALLLGAATLVFPRVMLRVLTDRRRSAFAAQFEGTLQMISGSLRAGYGLMQAVATVAEESPAPTSQEFGRVAVENQLGRTVEESLRAMADRMDNEDLRWVVEAIDIQYEVGGDLAEVLDTVGETIRDRNQIRRQVKALSAEGRISAIILVSLPFAIALLISMVSPDYLAELTQTAVGRVMIGGALLMIGAGAAWIRRIVKVVF